MHFHVLTLFPEMFAGPLDVSILKRAKEKGLATIDLINIRDFATDHYASVDDRPYGGGQGMVMRVDIIDRALSSIPKKGKILLLDPIGQPYTQKKAKQLSAQSDITFICGHYEGVDERVRTLVDESISIGDYILTGGELPAMVIIDSIVRLLEGALGDEMSNQDESFSDGAMLEYPQYTRPDIYKNLSVPDILKSGNHKAIEEWKKEQSKQRTAALRPDLILKEKKD